MRKISIQQFRDKFGDETKNLPVMVEKRGECFGVFLSYDDYKKIVNRVIEDKKEEIPSTKSFQPHGSGVKFAKITDTNKKRGKTPKTCGCGGMILGFRCQRCQKSYF